MGILARHSRRTGAGHHHHSMVLYGPPPTWIYSVYNPIRGRPRRLLTCIVSRVYCTLTLLPTTTTTTREGQTKREGVAVANR